MPIDASQRTLRRWVLLFAITLGFMARMATFQVPLFDHHSWRQADGATIARNFYRNGISPLHPAIDARGAAADGTVATGLELHAILFAAVSRVTGFSDIVGRVVSAACFPASALCLWVFCRNRYGEDYALIAAFVYSLGLPLVLYAERSVWNEPLLILLSMAALAAAQGYLTTARPERLLALLVSLGLIAAVKPQWLIMLAPVWALWFERDGWRFLRRWDAWLVAAVPVLTAAAFLWHMQEIAARTQLTFGAADKLFQLSDVTAHVAFVIARRLVRDLFGPVGIVALAVGLVIMVRQRRVVELAGTAGSLFYLVAVLHGNRAHDYYQLALVPAALMILPAGILALADLVERRFSPAWTRQRAAVTLMWLMLFSCFVRSVSFHSWYEVDQDKVQFCSLLRPQLAPGELVVFADYNNPDLLYCLDRRGWFHIGAPMTAADVQRKREEGAAVLVMPASSAPALLGEGPPLARTDDWLAVRIAR